MKYNQVHTLQAIALMEFNLSTVKDVSYSRTLFSTLS